MSKEVKKFYRPKQGAKYLGISLSGYWLLVKKGLIPTIKLSPKVTVTSKEDLDLFVASRMS
jgi:hypothetical protein